MRLVLGLGRSPGEKQSRWESRVETRRTIRWPEREVFLVELGALWAKKEGGG